MSDKSPLSNPVNHYNKSRVQLPNRESQYQIDLMIQEVLQKRGEYHRALQNYEEDIKKLVWNACGDLDNRVSSIVEELKQLKEIDESAPSKIDRVGEAHQLPGGFQQLCLADFQSLSKVIEEKLSLVLDRYFPCITLSAKNLPEDHYSNISTLSEQASTACSDSAGIGHQSFDKLAYITGDNRVMIVDIRTWIPRVTRSQIADIGKITSQSICFKGDKLVITGGKIREQMCLDCYSYDLNTFETKRLPYLNSPRCNHASVSWNEIIFVLGGETRNNWIEKLELEGDRLKPWKIKQELPEVVSHPHASVLRDVIYLVGKSNTVYTYNIMASSMSQLSFTLFTDSAAKVAVFEDYSSLVFLQEEHVIRWKLGTSLPYLESTNTPTKTTQRLDVFSDIKSYNSGSAVHGKYCYFLQPEGERITLTCVNMALGPTGRISVDVTKM